MVNEYEDTSTCNDKEITQDQAMDWFDDLDDNDQESIKECFLDEVDENNTPIDMYIKSGDFQESLLADNYNEIVEYVAARKEEEKEAQAENQFELARGNLQDC